MKKDYLKTRFVMHKIGMVKKYIYYNMSKIKLPFYPDRLYLELTNKCNFQCIMCPNGRGLMERKKGFMDYELFKSIIDEMGPHVQTVVLHIWGESLLHPRIFDIIKYCQRYDLRTELSTNSSLLDEKLINNILDSGLDAIYLCIDGFTKETYEKVRKMGDYEKTVKNVEDFLAIKKLKGLDKPSVYLQIIIMKETLDEVEKFKKRWSIGGVDKINIKPLDTWGGQVSDINDLQIERNKGRTTKTMFTKRYHCPNIWYHAHIYWDGTLVCCDRDFDAKNSLGNVSEGVMKLWSGPKMEELRRKHIDLNLDGIPCSNCNEWRWWRPGLFSSWGNLPRE